MIKRGAKKQVLENKVKVNPYSICSVCGASGSEPCTSQARGREGLAVKNHAGREV